MDEPTINNIRKTHGFAKGNRGRPKGSRNKSTVLIEALLEGEAEAIGRTCVERAKAGDPVALRLAMERISPVRRGRPVRFDMPAIANTSDIANAVESILHAVASGQLTPDEGATLANILETKRRAVETVELERRVVELETQLARRNY